MVHVGVVVHPLQKFTQTSSLLGELVAIWIRRGIRVSLIRGPAPGIKPDVVFLHVDLTETPPEYVGYLDGFPVVLNRRVTDISKRRISRNLVVRAEDYDGPVIVKTNRNSNGIPEASLERALRPTSLPPPTPGTAWLDRTALRDYPVFASTSDVPKGVWANRNLVVERFLPERDGDRYCIRTWLFLGEQERMARFFATEPVIKSDNIVGRERLHEVPEDLRQLRRELGFDFGKFDFAVVDGRTVLYDANRTPTLGVIPRADFIPWLTKFSDGLWSFTPRPPEIPEAPSPEEAVPAAWPTPADLEPPL